VAAGVIGRAGVLFGASLIAGSCGPATPEVRAPAFAAALPGHTVAAWWSEGQTLPAVPWPRTAEAWLGVARGMQTDTVQTWTGDERAVAWRSFAENRLLLTALASAPLGTRRLFVDLQQLVDLALQAATKASASAAGPAAAVRGLLVQHIVSALRLRSLQWLIAGDRVAGDRRHIAALVAATDTSQGVCGLVGGSAPWTLPRELPRKGADVVLAGFFVPSVFVRIVRDLMTGDDEGPLQMAREILRGARLQAGIAALQALDGQVLLCAREGFAYARLGVADPRALGDALDDLAQPASEGWQIGGWRVQVTAAGAVATLGATTVPLEAIDAPAAGLVATVPQARVQVALRRSAAHNRIEVDAVLRSPR
jgi:hypothetical protein